MASTLNASAGGIVLTATGSAALNIQVGGANAIQIGAGATTSISNISFTSLNITTVTAASANITTLTGTSTNITTATHASANITQLQSTSATITTLTGTSANITTLSGTSANITTLTGTTVSDSAGNVRSVPQSGTAKTSSYTLVIGDNGEYIQLGTGGAVTIPDGVFSTGNIVSVFNNTASNATITCAITTAYISGTDSDKATMTLAARGVATVLFISNSLCVVNGNVS